eukprot:m.82436 g.82436  ORF g.82436 m.82436 type:complete len:334 (-) comp14918_c0_seq1:289-1290(-)
MASSSAAAAAARQTPLTCSGHTRPVVDLCFSHITPDGFFLISACKDGKPMIRNGQTGDWLGTFEGHKGAVWGATLDANAERAATASADFTVKLWDAVTGEDLHTFSHPHIVKAVTFTPDKHHVVSACNDKNVRIFDLHAYSAEPVVLTGHTKTLKKVLSGADSNTLLSAGDDKCVKVWDRRTAKETTSISVSGEVTNMELSAENNILLVTYGKTVAFYDATSLQLIKQHTTSCSVYAASLHPNKHTFVWGGENNMMNVVEYETFNQTDEFKGHFGPIHCVQYSPDGQLYASGSEDGTVRLWQTHVGQEYGLWRFTKAEGEEAATPAAAPSASA